VNGLFAAALELQQFFQARSWRFCFIGGLAVQRWGEPRLTLDVDCTVLTGFGGEESYVDEMLGAFEPRVTEPREFALLHRVLLLYTRSRIPADVALGAMPFEERSVARASPYDIGDGHSILTCSAEDLIVFKTFAGRERDWLDVRGVLVRQGESLNTELIWQELGPLLSLKGDTEAESRFWRLLRERGRSEP
jgi:hypothetical protein